MASLWDFDFTGDDPGPDTDPTPDSTNGYDDWPFDLVEDDATDYKEPGVGDTFLGQDPTVFAAEGNPDEPGAQTSDVPPLEAEQQTATNNDPQNFGEKDDPESQEQPGDQQAGDNEDDTADPADVDSSGIVDSADDIEYPEQGIDNDETTTRQPERIEPAETTPFTVAPFMTVLRDQMRRNDLIDLYKDLLNRPEDLGLLIDRLLDLNNRSFDTLNPVASPLEPITPDTDAGNNYVIDLESAYDLKENLLDFDLFQDLFEAATDSTLAFSILEPDEVSQEFTETFWPNDDDILIDLQDFVDVPETSAMAVNMSDFFDTAQPPQYFEVVAALQPNSELGIFYDV